MRVLCSAHAALARSCSSTASLALIGTATTSAPQLLGDDEAEQIARAGSARAGPCAVARGEHGGDQRTIGVAVGGDDGVDGGRVALGLADEPLQRRQLLVVDVLGVDGDEGARERPTGTTLGAERGAGCAAPARARRPSAGRTATRRPASAVAANAVDGSGRRSATSAAPSTAAAPAARFEHAVRVEARRRRGRRVLLRRARRSIAARMPGSSDFKTSPTLLLILMPLRSNGMWLPVTITPARPVAMPCSTSAGVGTCPAFSTPKPLSTIACIAAAHDARRCSGAGRRRG